MAKKWMKMNSRFEKEKQEYEEHIRFKDHYAEDNDKLSDLELLSIYYSNNATIPLDISKFHDKR